MNKKLWQLWVFIWIVIVERGPFRTRISIEYLCCIHWLIDIDWLLIEWLFPNFFLPHFPPFFIEPFICSDMDDIAYEEMNNADHQERTSLASVSSGNTTDSEKVCSYFIHIHQYYIGWEQSDFFPLLHWKHELGRCLRVVQYIYMKWNNSIQIKLRCFQFRGS